MSTPHRPYLRGAIWAYACFVAVICFMPQPDLGLAETPGIQRFGRLVVLLRPFNSLWALGDVTSLPQLVWIITQNFLNIFLLYPLVFGVMLFYPTLRSMASAVKLAFYLSLTIEVTQVLLSLSFDANRVFEIDDLWTNTLGGYLAYLTYTYLRRVYDEKNRSL